MYEVLVVNDWHAVAAVFFGIYQSQLVVYVFFISANLFVVNILLNVMISFFVGAFSLNDKETKDIDNFNSVFESKLGKNVINQVHSFQREGRFDHMVKTIAGQSDNDRSDAIYVSEALGLLETLYEPTGVGFMVCCQSTLARYGNERFSELFRDYIGHNMMHTMLSDLQTDLRSKNITIHKREYFKEDKILCVNASLVSNTKLCLFVAFEK